MNGTEDESCRRGGAFPARGGNANLTKPAVAVAIAFWLVAVAAGIAWLERYSATPGNVSALPPRSWPGTVSLARDPHRMTLVMTVHPRCSCSRASLHELGEIMAHARGRVAAKVIFVHPSGTSDDWVHGSIWNLATSMPEVTVSVDQDGAIARALNATTSGQVTLYDAAGRLLFSGGLTSARGHEGGNLGVDTVLSALKLDAPASIATPVYGCSLFGPRHSVEH